MRFSEAAVFTIAIAAATLSSCGPPVPAPGISTAKGDGAAVPAVPAVALHRASEADLPPWAKQGMFHFIRVDGGDIESKKALRTHWGRHFSPPQIDVLTHIYGKYSGKLLDRLTEAGYTWMWVTWSNGWSAKEEGEQWQILRPFIAEAHARGIKITAYMSASNMFWESVFRDEPRAITWVRMENGLPVNYHGRKNPMRFLAEIGNPEWQKYLVSKGAAAIDAGVDAVFFDNVKGHIPDLAVLFSEFQKMTMSKARELGRPKIPLYINAHLDPEKMVLNDICELIHNEYGTTTPGVWPDTGWNVSNVRKTRFLHGGKFPWQSHKYEIELYHCGSRETCIPTPVEEKLAIAEAWAFGAGYSKNLEGPFLEEIILDKPAGLATWAAMGQYNRWITQHRQLYTDVEPVADIAILAQTDGRKTPGSATFRLMDQLIRQSIMYGVKVRGRFAQGRTLKDYGVLVIPELMSELSRAEIEALGQYAAGGGRILTTEADREKYTWPGARAIASAHLADLTSGRVPAGFLQSLIQATGGPILSLGGPGNHHVVASVMRKRQGRSALVHLINYDHDNVVRDLRLTVKLARVLPSADPGRVAVEIVSPDGEPAGKPSTRPAADGTSIEIAVERLAHYAVVSLGAPSP